MRAGSLNERVVFLAPTKVSDEAGGAVTTWEPILDTFARVRELSVSNDLIAQQNNVTGVLEFTIRYRQDVILKTGHKIDWRGRRFELIPNFAGGILNREYISIRAVAEIENSGDGS